jgi:hypothetical protein
MTIISRITPFPRDHVKALNTKLILKPMISSQDYQPISIHEMKAHMRANQPHTGRFKLSLRPSSITHFPPQKRSQTSHLFIDKLLNKNSI